MRKIDKIIISALAVICIALGLLFYQINNVRDGLYYTYSFEQKIRDLEHKIEEAETATEEIKREIRKYR